MPKPKKKRNKKYSPKKIKEICLQGIIVSWSDRDPLADSSEILDGKITHKNPCLQPIADRIFHANDSALIKREAFLWLVTITVVARVHDTGDIWRETRELEARCRLLELEEHSAEQIEDAMNYCSGAEYITTEFRCEILSR